MLEIVNITLMILILIILAIGSVVNTHKDSSEKESV